MKLFKNYCCFVNEDLLSVSWVVRRGGEYGFMASLSVSFNTRKIILHSHNQELETNFTAKMLLLQNNIRNYLKQDGTQTVGNRLWLNHADSKNYMLGSTSYFIDTDGYSMFTIADCQYRVFFEGRDPRLLAFLGKLADSITQLIAAIDWSAAVPGQATAD